MKHLTGLMFAALTAALLLAACQPAAGGGEARTVYRGNTIEPLSLDPDKAHIMDERVIIADLFTGLYEPTANARPVPALASASEVSDDGLVWTFTLREALWSDGTPITADDVVFGLQRALDPATGNQFGAPLFPIANAQAVYEGRVPPASLGVRAIDERTVEMTLEGPTPFLPSILMFWGQPVPRHVVEAHGDAWIRPDNIVTSGAFILVDWRVNDFIHLRANPTFFDAANVCLTDVYYFPTVDTAAAERRVRSGELDLNNDFASGNTAFLTERAPEIVRVAPGTLSRTLDFNTTSPPFDDVRVRRALAMAIDRAFITDTVLGGSDMPATRVVAEGIAGRRDDVRIDYIDQSMEARRAEARALLEAAGFGPDNPLAFTLFYQPSASWPRTVPVIQQDWATIAPWVQVELAGRDSQLHYDAMRVGDFQVATSGWVPDFDDPYAYLLQWETRAGEINYARYSNPDFDALTAAAVATPDPAERADLLAQAERLFLADSASTPILFEASRDLVSPRITGWQTNRVGINQSRWLCTTDVVEASE
jgi:oligopeptide transport system substrate-binding protein